MRSHIENGQHMHQVPYADLGHFASWIDKIAMDISQAFLTTGSSEPNSRHEKGLNQKTVIQITKESSKDTGKIKCYERKGQHIF